MPNTIVIAGDGAGSIAREVAEAGGRPLLAEPTSGALGSPNAIAAYRYLLPLFAAGKIPGARPQNALVFGRPTLNRTVIEFLANPKVNVTVVTKGDPPYPDAWRNTATFLPESALLPITAERDASSSSFLTKWLTVSQAVAQAIGNLLNSDISLSDSELAPLAVAHQVLHAEPALPLFLGASNPIRDVDLVLGISNPNHPHPILANRGVAGIDGTIATALGVATALGGARLYLGDLAFFHDVSSLLRSLHEPRPNLQIIVANDGGGSIFTGLEHGHWAHGQPSRERTIQRVFTTPQNADIPALCAGFRVAYRRAMSLSALHTALTSDASGVEVVEVELNGHHRRLLHRRLQTAITAAVVQTGLATE